MVGGIGNNTKFPLDCSARLGHVLLDLLFDQAAEAGASVLAVTHDHELLPRFDRVLDFAAFREDAPA